MDNTNTNPQVEDKPNDFSDIITIKLPTLSLSDYEMELGFPIDSTHCDISVPNEFGTRSVVRDGMPICKISKSIMQEAIERKLDPSKKKGPRVVIRHKIDPNCERALGLKDTDPDHYRKLIDKVFCVITVNNFAVEIDESISVDDLL